MHAFASQTPDSNGRTPRQCHLDRLAALKSERDSWIEHWRDLSEHILPRSSRFLATDRNRGDKKNASIINSTATKASRTQAAGMMAGCSSPSSVWFRLTTPDPELSEFGPVKAWVDIVEGRLRQALAKSNVYNCLHQVYADLGVFGTSALYVEDDPLRVVRGYVFPVGQYCLANDDSGRANTAYREFSMTVGQLVSKFQIENCSGRVQDLYKRGRVDEWIEVVHLIEPNREAKHGRLGPEGMKWKSCWLEKVSPDDKPYLLESGYQEFPVMAPRWNVTGEDVYGHSPGMDALGDIRALQKLERRKAQAFDKVVDPPMVASGMQGQRSSLLPGSWLYPTNPNPKPIYPAIDINPAAMGEAREAIREHAERIRSDFYADLFLMLAQGESAPDMTAREVAERHEEKMQQLGPVMERLQDELYGPLIDRVFYCCLRNGDIPEPPQELQGADLKVEYMSIMAQAQKMRGISNIRELTAFVGSLAAANHEVLDKIDFDQTVDEYGEMLGVPPAIIRTDEAVAALRQARAKAEQQAAQQQQAMAMAEGAKTLSQADTGGDNALTRLLEAQGGGAH